MTDSTTGHVSPYHPGCKHRYSEHMDHNALIARLNDIADQQYKLLQLCNQLESNLNEHDNSETAHAYIRTIIDNTSTRLGVIKAQIDADLATLRNTHTNDISTLTAADTAIQSRIDSLDDELDRVEREFTVDLTNIDHAINSNVSSGNLTNANSGTAIINGTAAAGYNMLYKGKSTHGKFTTGIDNTSYVVNYSADANNTNTPTYKATLLDENGNASFPNTVAATTFSGNATSATVANTAGKLTNSFNLSIQDASGNNSGAAVAVDGSRNVVLKMPDTLSNTNITGTANRAYADGNGANIADTYVHKTNVDETVAGTKSFSGTVKGNTIVPVTHAGATVGTNATPYENVYSTNFKGTNANINNITGNLTGNATSATKLQTARAINGTNFDGTGAITTKKWGTARNLNIADASGTNNGAASSIDGSGNVTLKLPATIKANVTGNASTATQLSGSKKVNGTVFNGTSDITTEKWGTARNLSIADASGTNTGAATSVNGDANVTLKLPATIKGTLTGNADSATEFSSNATVAITGDATGTSAGSKKGWSVPVTLANSGVVAGTYGPSGNVTGEDGVTISVPQITVDAKGRVTSVINRTYTSVNDTDDVDWSLYPYKLNSISSYGHGRWEYINLENAASNDFNSLVAPGKFQVRYNANTLNAPVSDGSSHDGILEVEGTTSAANVTSYQRCYQTYTLYSNGRPRQFIRKGYYSSGAWNWDSEWVEFADTTNDTKVTQTATTADNHLYPVLVNDEANATATKTSSVKFHPNTVLNTANGVFYTGNSAVNITKGFTGSAAVDQGGICTRLSDRVTSVGWLKWTTEANGGRYCYISSRNYIKDGAPAADGSEVGCTLAVGVTAVGKRYVSATVDYDTDDNSTKVATTKWVKAQNYLTSHQDLSNYVTLNSAQTISATKTISADLKFSTTATRGTAPSGTISKRIANYVDSAGNNIGLIGMYYNSNMSSETKIFAYKTTEATGSNIGYLGIGCDATGSIYTIAPTPATDDNSTKIATTKWVKSQNYLTSHQSLANYVTLNSTQTITGSKTFSSLIAGSINGNADTATKLKTARAINGTNFDGTGAITTEKWGTARNITITDAAASHSGSAVSVNGSGNVTLKLPSSIVADAFYGPANSAGEFTVAKSVTLTGDVTGTASSKAGWSIATTLKNSGVTAGTYGPSANVTGNDNATISVPQITVDAKGRVTSVANKTLTCKNTVTTLNDATKTSKGVMRVGDDLDVYGAVVSVAENFLRVNKGQRLTTGQINCALSNLGILMYGSGSSRNYCNSITIGDLQILYGQTTVKRGNYFVALFRSPFIIDAPFVIGTGFSVNADSDATCCVIGRNHSPRSVLFGTGSSNHISRCFYLAIGPRFPLVEDLEWSLDVSSGTTDVTFTLLKSYFNLTEVTTYILIDMFILATAGSGDYIEFSSISGVSDPTNITIGSINKKISNTIDNTSDRYVRGWDVDLSYETTEHKDAVFGGYPAASGGKLFNDSKFSKFLMRTVLLSTPSSNISNSTGNGIILTFHRSLSSGVYGHIRLFPSNPKGY